MSPMSDQPITLAMLAQFHRDVLLPDMHRVFEVQFERLVKPRFDEIDGHFDAIYHKLDKLETEYESLKAGVKRVEERVDRVDVRLEALERQYQDLLAAVNRLEERLSRVEKQVDAIVAAQEKEPLRAEVADLRARVDSLQAQVRSLESRLDQ
jgi:chromosome segregation ATPase